MHMEVDSAGQQVLLTKVLKASPRHLGDFPIEVSGSPWLPRIWRRLTRQGVRRTQHGQKGNTRGRKRCCAWEQKGHAGEKGTVRGRKREVARGRNESDSHAYTSMRRCPTWNPRHLRVGGKERREGKRRRQWSTWNPAVGQPLAAAPVPFSSTCDGGLHLRLRSPSRFATSICDSRPLPIRNASTASAHRSVFSPLFALPSPSFICFAPSIDLLCFFGLCPPPLLFLLPPSSALLRLLYSAVLH
jgi:hypothetical protein